MKTVEIPVPTFDSIVSVFVGEDTGDMKPYFEDGQLDNIEGSNFRGLCFEATAVDGRERRVIWVRELSAHVLAHEIYHCVKYILDWAGVNDHETGAFLTEYLFRESMILSK
jgi:hypothetical protein